MRISLPTLARRFVRWEYVPEAVLGAGLTAFLLDQTDAATSAFKSTRALAIMAATAAGWFGARLLAARLVRLTVARAAVFSAAAAVALAVVVLPAYDNETVIESFPTAAAVPVSAPPAEATATDAPPGADGAPATSSAPPTAPPTTRPPEPRPTTTTTAARPSAAPAAPAPKDPPATTTSTAAADPPDTAPAAAAPQPASASTGPQRLRAGAIRGIDHRASGTAATYRQPDGRYVVGLEDIDIQPGPDYDLYVVPGEDREDVKGGIRLGDLRGNRGTQFYEVPDGANLEDGPWTVLVWCQTFAVPVAGATPS